MAIERYNVTAADGTAIPVWKSGVGPPLLIVHGAACNHEAWEPVRPYLDAQRTVAIMDRRASFGDPLSTLELETEFDDVARVAATLGDEVDLLGHSSGALCVMGAALQMQDLGRLILYEPPMIAGVEPPPEAVAAFEKMWEQREAGDLAGILKTFGYEIVGPGLADPQAFVQSLQEFEPFAQHIPREMAALGACTTLAPEGIAQLEVPTLFLIGSDTPPGPLRGYLEALHGVMPNFAVAELPGGEHLANLLTPDVVAERVNTYLSTKAPAEPA